MAVLSGMKIITVEELEEQLGVIRWPQFVAACEQTFSDEVAALTETLLAKPQIKAVFVSGPTSSGKTTLSHRLTRSLTQAGRNATVLSLDDYYRVDEVRYDACGRPDFESIDTLEVDLLGQHLTQVLAGQTVGLPLFDFVHRRRVYDPKRTLRLDERDILLIEGLHGLSDEIFSHLPREQIYGVFLMPLCSLLHGRQLIGSRGVRMLRRISRDVLHRGSTALSTLDYWPMLDRTEQAFFPAYLSRADVYINTCLPYEFCIVPPLAARQIQVSLDQYADGSLCGSIYMKDQQGYADLPTALEEARYLLDACAQIPAADSAIVPEQSILREFIA